MKKELMKAAFETIINNSADLLFLKDANLIYQAASEPFVKMTKKSSISDVIGHNDFEIFEDEKLAERYVADDHKLFSAGEDLVDYVEPITGDGGRTRYGLTSKYILRSEKGEVIGLLGITKDVTKDFLMRQRYQQELKYLFELPEDTYAICYIDIDNWRIISQKRQKIDESTMQVCHTVEEMCQFAIESIIDTSAEAAEFYRNFSAENLMKIYDSGRKNLAFEYERKMADGSVRWVLNEVHFLFDIENEHLCVMLFAKDIHSLKLRQKEIIQAAKLDKMTMLLNRETTINYISHIFENESEGHHALMMLDIDNFKGLNDTLGHQIGDEFLVETAKVLKSCFRESDVVGRIGGDEFFVLMRNVSDAGQVEIKAKNILDAVQRVSEKYPGVEVSASIGISLYPRDGATVEEIYSKADEALYEAKRFGKNQYVLSEPSEN